MFHRKFEEVFAMHHIFNGCLISTDLFIFIYVSGNYSFVMVYFKLNHLCQQVLRPEYFSLLFAKSPLSLRESAVASFEAMGH